jgi:hypothetical protein
MIEPKRDSHQAVWGDIVGQVTGARTQWGLVEGARAEEKEFLLQGRFLGEAQWVKENRQRLVFHSPGPESGIFGKVNFYQGWRDALKGAFRNKAREEIEAIQSLLACGIPVVEPLAWCSGKGFDLIFTRAFAGSSDVEELVRKQGPCIVFRELCQLAKLLLEQGVSWSDFHIRNVLARHREGSWELRLVDVYGARCGSRMSQAVRQRMVSRFFSSLPGFPAELGGELFDTIDRHLGDERIPDEEIPFPPGWETEGKAPDGIFHHHAE